MTLDVQFCLLPEGGHDLGRMLHRAETLAGISLDLVDGVKTRIGKFPLFDVAEQVFDRVEFGRIGRQAFEYESIAERLDIVAHVTTAMCGQTVPDDQQLAADLLTKGLQEHHQLWRLDGAGKESRTARR